MAYSPANGFFFLFFSFLFFSFLFFSFLFFSFLFFSFLFFSFFKVSPLSACSSNEDLSDDEHSPTNERGTYHNPFGAPEPAESSPSLNGSVGFSPLPVKEEKDHKTFRGSVIDGMRGSKKKPSPKASPKASPRHNRGSSPQERLCKIFSSFPFSFSI